MSRKKRATDEEVLAFIAAVYPEAPHLAMAAFDESQCLRDATAELARLAARVAELEAENAKLRACIQPGGMLTCPFCLEGDFDKEGLLRHLNGLPMSGWSCDAARAEVKP